MLSVQKQIEEVAPKFNKKQIVKLAKKVVREDDVNDFLKRNSHLSGLEFVDVVLDYFDFDFRVSNRDLLNIPTSGRVVIIANHPLGGLDGLVLLKLVSEIRKDVKIIANDFLSKIDALSSMFLNIDVFKEKNLKQNVQKVYKALNNEEAVIVFPGGEVSRAGLTGIKDGKWKSGFLNFAVRTDSPIVPVYVEAKNSKTFYAFSVLNKSLSTLLLPNEMFKNKSKTINLKIGEAVLSKDLPLKKHSKKEIARLFRKHIYNLPKSKKSLFATQKPIAKPENIKEIKKELKNSKVLVEINKEIKVYLYEYKKDDAILKEIGRLRELSFRKVGEGVNKNRDTDKYDTYYKHIILWDEKELEIMGAYRVARGSEVYEKMGSEGFYSSTLFGFTEEFEKLLPNSLELGRSFIQPKYWNSKALDYLWIGIGKYVLENSEIRYLFGPVSVSAAYSKLMQGMMISFFGTYYGHGDEIVKPNQRFKYTKENRKVIDKIFTYSDFQEDMKSLKRFFTNHGTSIPPLYKHYTSLCEEGGVKFLGFSIDKDFSDCLDGFVLVDLNKLKAKKRERYLKTD